MRMMFGAPLLYLLSCFPAAAAEEVGRGVICDTAKQVEQFVTYRNHGMEPRTALQAVNDEAHSTSACNYAMVVFTSDKPVIVMTMNGRLVHILQITVLAFGDGSAWKRMPDTVQYTPIIKKGLVI
jgi:hypothetical protein